MGDERISESENKVDVVVGTGGKEIVEAKEQGRRGGRGGIRGGEVIQNEKKWN